MAGRRIVASKSGIALTAATAETVIQVKAVNTPLRLLRLTCFFKGTSNTDAPALVELVRQTSGGTMSALTLRLRDNGIAYTINATAQHTATAEPADVGVVLFQTYVHPQTTASFPLSELGDDIVDVGTWLGVRITAAANVTAGAELDCEE